MALPDWAVGACVVILTLGLVIGLGAAAYLGLWQYAATVVSLYMTLVSFIAGGAMIYHMGLSAGRQEIITEIDDILNLNVPSEEVVALQDLVKKYQMVFD